MLRREAFLQALVGCRRVGAHGVLRDPRRLLGPRRCSADDFEQDGYTFEYTIKSEQGWFRHNVAVFAEFGGRLYTLVAQVPETEWETRRDDFRRTAESFRVFVPTG